MHIYNHTDKGNGVCMYVDFANRLTSRVALVAADSSSDRPV